MIEFRNLNQRYGGTQIIWDLSLDIATGSCTCLMGRNGVGKTTLLKCLMGLLPISGGDILLDGKSLAKVPAHARAGLGIGF
ncbi:MAG TPA: ATP-binding cassette domain-containing protein, partial [Candidatus Acidoferrum sp.]|nr:ATP-binding cassette domain-containing protein [Candidatus Acidoferrum sp.]